MHGVMVLLLPGTAAECQAEHGQSSDSDAKVSQDKTSQEEEAHQPGHSHPVGG